MLRNRRELIFICYKIFSVTSQPVKRVKFVRFLTLIFAHLFAVVHSLPCLFSVNGSSGFISSSGTKNYRQCTWIITAPSNHTVKLKFMIFRLSDRRLWWDSARIQVHDGKRKNDTILGFFSGARQPFIIQTSGRFMMVALQKVSLSTPCNFKGTYYTSQKKGQRQ